MNHGVTYRSVIERAHAGVAVVDYLAVHHAHSDAATWCARIGAGEVTVDGAVVPATAVLAPGQVLSWAKPPWQEPAAPLDFVTLYQDDDVIAVAKPAGLPTLPGSGYEENTLLARVRLGAPLASPAHRLGRGTSGLVLFTKNADAARAVQAQWQAGSVTKIYRALLQGVFADDAVDVDARIGLVADAVVGELYAASASGKSARSRFRVIERHEACTLVDVVIETGRPHQIRIHAAAAGHPLLDDPLYGAGGGRRSDSTARPGDIGYHLHAHHLALRHPRTDEPLALTAPLPPLLVEGAIGVGGSVIANARAL